MALGCADAPIDTDDGSSSLEATAVAPLVGNGTDSADRACNVVLRTLDRVSNNMGGYQTSCIDGSCYYLWQGTLEVSADAAASSTPVVLFQSGSDPTWWQGAVSPLSTTDGSHLYSVVLNQHTVTDGMSLSSLMHTRIQVAPALVLNDGSRWFDHNRNAGDFDNYVLDATDGWSVRDNAAICPAAKPAATLRFLPDWSEVQDGAIVAGGELTVDYDPARLAQCAGRSDQLITASARFSPSGELVSAPVLTSNDGVPAKALWTLELPTAATGVELWFSTSATGCQLSWDSNYGSNYSFAVTAPATGHE